MKRAHRKSHLWMWLLLGPVMLAVITLAMTHRTAEPVNNVLPPALIKETG